MCWVLGAGCWVLQNLTWEAPGDCEHPDHHLPSRPGRKAVSGMMVSIDWTTFP